MTLRPTTFEQIVGQTEAKQRLKIAVAGAKSRNEALGHILLSGPAGLGKTTLSQCVANEMDTKLTIMNGATTTTIQNLVKQLANIEGGILFIDEIHRLPTRLQEVLYTAMEDFRIDFTHKERTISMPLPKFTLIGATTEAGMLTKPFRDRFIVRASLEFYSEDELTELVKGNVKKLGMCMDEAACRVIASRSRGTPRLANSGLLWLRDFAAYTNENSLDESLAETGMEACGIDERGLSEQDRSYLEVLRSNNGPVGLEAIANTLNVSVNTVSDDIEPYLLRSGLVNRTPRGRTLTNA
jgi:Holliday junction DNA helicase RuvB